MSARTRHHLTLAASICLGLSWWYITSNLVILPVVTPLRTNMTKSSSYMELARQRGIIDHRPVPLSKIALSLRQAVVISEDSRFSEHHGFDWEAIKDAMSINWRRKRFSRGASTITQQLARTLYLVPRKTPLRKLREFLIALELELFLSKDRILELYVNSVEWGKGIFGAEAAARHYFGKSASQLSTHQAAFLAAILPNPRYYDDHRNTPLLQR
ncbi:MAG: monofunctional biosynthetic peptidoglycan transglycosylase, partial [Deltaproteobacteria bacterium]|nr:monofunctional biosynthetic peptidoglycan transglycosylase [Deltaproteobacteria bacterium]